MRTTAMIMAILLAAVRRRFQAAMAIAAITPSAADSVAVAQPA
jgi:hypothetical protein